MANASITAVSTLEGNAGATNAVWTITRVDTTNAEDYYVQYSHSGRGPEGGTTDGNDFINSGAIVGFPIISFGAGQATATFTIGIRGDVNVEPDETYYVELYSVVANNYTIIQTVYGTILDDDGVRSQFSVNDVMVNEGSATTGSTALTFAISRDNADAAGTVAYSFAHGTTDAADFAGGLPAGGTASFAAGVFTQQVTVNVAPDFAVEANETLQINLASPTGGTILDSQGIGTIVNDEANYSIVQTAFVEGDTGSANMIFTVTPDRAVPVAQTVYFTFGGGTAIAGTDYDATARSVTFAANGTGGQTFTVPVFGDYTIEGSETFGYNAYRVMSGGLYSQQFATGSATITDTATDVAGSITINDVSIVEDNAGTSTALLTVTRTGGSGDFSVNYATTDGGGTLAAATAGSDYTATGGTLFFTGGATTRTISVPVRGDTVLEPNEQLTVTLSGGPLGLTIADASGLVTIVNDDGGPGITPGTGSGGSTVTTSSSFVASPDAQVSSIQTSNAAGTDPINLTGNFRDQQITGNNGDNIINGGGGNDTLVGLGGNDTFLVRGPGDVVIEANGGGRDTVFTTVSYNLGVNEIEVLSTVENAATDPINLIGNFTTQLVIGNYGNNILNGGSGGLDTLIGLRGDDLYAVGDSRTVIVENAGEGADTVVASVEYTLAAGVSVEVLAAQNRGGTEALTLRGNELAQTVVGNDGANIIDGGAGSDVLVGGGGADRFAFTTALGNGNVDAIVDFAAGTDRIQLSSAIFGAVGTSVAAAGFVTGTAATTADQHIVYNATTGQIFYDADGSGAGAAILFATVAAGTQLSAASFEVAAPVVIA